jgi:hypothetical protein
MRRFQQDQILSLFGGEHIPVGYRGRRSQPEAKQLASGCVLVTLGILIFRFVGAATATTGQIPYPKAQQIERTLPANAVKAYGAVGLADLLY